MIIVHSENTIQSLKTQIDGGADVIIIPVFSDIKRHPKLNRVSFYYLVIDGDEYVIGDHHTQAIRFSIQPLLQPSVRVYNKKALAHLLPEAVNCKELLLSYYITEHSIPSLSFDSDITVNRMYMQFDNMKNLHDAVPLAKLTAACRDFVRQLTNDSETGQDKTEHFLDTIAIPTLFHIEQSGLHVDRSTLLTHKPMSKRHIKRDLIFSEYNPFTTTGRVTNKHGGLNFAALDKKSGIRSAFTSRFSDGVMVSIDYESFHVRLLAQLMKYDLPTDTDAHTYFAKQYFKTDSPTYDQREEGKKKTFFYMYGNIDDDAPEFFLRVRAFIADLTSRINNNEHILSPFYGRRVTLNAGDTGPAKLLSYYMQLAETEFALTRIHKCLALLKDHATVPVLYTYDSILFDYSLSDGKELLLELTETLSMNNRLPVSVEYGKSYGSLTKLSL
jgi:hypothetical protein